MRLAAALFLLLIGCDGCSSGAAEPSGRGADGLRRAAAPAPDPDPGRAGQEREAGEAPPTLGGLRVRILGGPDGRGGGDGPVVVLLHGYGAPGDDLVGLARRLDVDPTVRFVLPEAPLEIGGAGRAWWRLDIGRLRSGTDRDLSDEVPEGMPAARRKVLSLVRDVERELGVPPSRIVLAGFSQGAMLALDVALHLEEPVAGVAVLSGTLVAEREWVPRMPAKETVPVFVSHGRQDPLLPFRMAEALRDRLETGGLTVHWVAFDGGHSIPPGVTEGLRGFLRTLR